jgi:hypothetical protein
MLGACPAQFYDLYELDRSPIAEEALRRIGVLYAIERESAAKHPTCAYRFASSAARLCLTA